jgi:hypothetical protein
MEHTAEEIQALKDNWIKDPCWEIEDTEGFEEHKEELLAYRLEVEQKAQERHLNKLKMRSEVIEDVLGITGSDEALSLHTFSEIENSVKYQDRFIGEARTHIEIVNAELAQAQIRATLLLASQIKRIADLLGGVYG